MIFESGVALNCIADGQNGTDRSMKVHGGLAVGTDSDAKGDGVALDGCNTDDMSDGITKHGQDHPGFSHCLNLCWLRKQLGG